MSLTATINSLASVLVDKAGYHLMLLEPVTLLKAHPPQTGCISLTIEPDRSRTGVIIAANGFSDPGTQVFSFRSTTLDFAVLNALEHSIFKEPV